MMKPLIEQITDAMIVEHEDNIVRAIQNIGIYVDKERLAKALIDSRSFYDEGYADAKAKYEKALDKACEGLENCYFNDTTKKIVDAYNYWREDCVYFSQDEWKEWCLDENR